MPEEIRITETEYNRIHPDFRGVWSTERYNIEGMGLTIVPDWRH